MIGYVDGSVRMHCDYCYARSPQPERPEARASGIVIRPPRWGVASRGGETRHACPRHTRQLRAWERGDE